MHLSLLRSATLLTAVGLTSFAFTADELKVLVFSKTKGFRHDSIEVGTQALKEIGKEAGWAVDATEDSTLFNDDVLKKYRAVVWLNTTGDVLDDAQQGAFERFIKSGGGYAGVHSASDTEYDWAWYGKLVGAYFKTHPEQQKAKLNVVDKNHPSTAHLPDVWERFDEWYTFRAAPTHVKVLMKIDESSYKGGGMDNNHPMCWYHEIDGGRAFYTASGHTKESYSEPDFRKHLLGGLKYAIGDKPLDYSKAPPSEARFEKVVISREMKDPMQFTILGDGRIVVVDRMGTVHVIKKDGSSVATEVPIYAVGSGKPNWEDGMIGIAADPDFAKNPYVYILHAVKGDEPKEHLMRYGFKGDQIDIASGKTVLEIKNCRTIIGHCGGGMSFGPDRQLFISTGDNTTPFESDGFSPLDTRVEGKDARATSANSMDLRGKILRIRIKEDGTYEIPKGNLFPVGTPNTRPEIYVMGCRNPFRHHYDPVTGWLLWGEVGPDSGNDSDTRGPKGHDEFNRAKGPGNFGWPLFVGNNKAYAGYDFETKKAGEKFDPKKPVNDSSRNTGIKDLPPAQEPLFWYPSSNSPEFPWLGNGGRCAMGGPLYRFDKSLKSDDKFPDYFEGKWFIYEWMRQWIKVVSFDKDGAVTGVEEFAPSIKFKKPMDMKFGPDGALYVLEYGNNWSDNTDSQLSKVVFAGGNRAPLAVAGSDKFVGKDPLTVQFNSDGTLDKDDGDTLTYAWDFGGKGSSAEAKPSFTFKEPGVYNVVLTVTDKGGKKSTAGMPIRVGNAEPVVKIVEPKAGAFFAWGQALPFKVDVSDDEDGSTTDGKLSANKIQVSGTYQDGTPPAAKGYEAAMLTGGSDKGRKLIGGSDCLACHQMNAISVGPAFMKIAQKYHKQNVMDTLIKKVIDGGQGVWGPMAMAPHPQHTPADVKEMVTWILSLADAPPPMNGATGSLMTPAKPAGNDRGVYIVTATYADAGAKGQPSLTGSASVVLRSRYLKATSCTTNKGLQEEDCADADKGRSFGFIDHDDHISFAGIDLSQTKAIEVRFASAGAGGIIEVHAGSPTGALVAKLEVGQTGGWQTWKTSEAAVVTDPGGSNELFFVFKSKSGSGGGLFNVNWVHFIEK